MNQGSTTIFWKAVDQVEQHLHSSEIVESVMQLSVLAKLATMDSKFGDYSSELGRSVTSSYTTSLLAAASESLQSLDPAPYHLLIDLKSPTWSDLPPKTISAVFDDLVAEFLENPNYRKSLLELVRFERVSDIGVPTEITAAMWDLLEKPKNVYFPMKESAFASLEISPEDFHQIARVELPTEEYLFARFLFCVGVKNTELETSGPLEGCTKRGVKTFAIPPWGGKFHPGIYGFKPVLPRQLQSKGPIDAVEAVIGTVASTAKDQVVALVPAGTLFGGGKSKKFREWLVEEVGLAGVIELPQNLLKNSSVACAILLIDPLQGPRDHVRLVSASDDWLETTGSGKTRFSGWKEAVDAARSTQDSEHSRSVGIETLRSNDFVLQMKRYLARENAKKLSSWYGAQTVPLSGLVEIIRPLALRDSDERAAEAYQEVFISDFRPDGTVSAGSKVRHLDEESADSAKRQILQSGDIVLGVKGTIGKAALVTEDAAPNLLCGQSCVILRLRHTAPIIDPTYLLRYFALPRVCNYLNAFSGGMAIKYMRANDLEDVPVPLLASEQQKKVCDTHGQIVSSFQKAEALISKVQLLSDGAFDPFVEAEAAADNG